MRSEVPTSLGAGAKSLTIWQGKKLIWVLIVGLVIGLIGCGEEEKPERPLSNQICEYLKKSEDEILAEVAKLPDEQIDLGLVSLVIAKGFYPDIDIKKYLRQLNAMADKLKQLIGDEKNPEKVIQIINHYLYDTKKMKMGSQTVEEAYMKEDKEAF